jgi:hypothetical protein
MSERDRDEHGRPRNARARDAAGRPLPPGFDGVARIPEDLVLDPGATLDEAQLLLDADRPFHAHEVLEAAWKAATGDERALWQGLAQLAVGLTHAQRGNAAGAVSLLARGAERIGPFASDPPHGIDVAGLVRFGTTLAERITAGGLDELAGADRRPRLVLGAGGGGSGGSE